MDDALSDHKWRARKENCNSTQSILPALAGNGMYKHHFGNT
jgi:hypothetical protein